jgi:two-component system, OmpR family, sensor histidine kinase KdpD
MPSIKIKNDNKLVPARENNYVKIQHSRGFIVGVDHRPFSENIIEWAAGIARKSEEPLYAVHVELQKKISKPENEQLAYNLNIARNHNAEIVLVAAHDVVDGLLRAANEKKAPHIVVGKYPDRMNIRKLFRRSIVKRLLRKKSYFHIHVINQSEKDVKSKLVNSVSLTGFFEKWKDYIIALAVTIGITIMSIPIVSIVGYRTVALIYLLAVSFLSVISSRGPMLLAAILSAVIWDFIFIPPMFSFIPTHIEDAMMLGTYCLIALILGYMTSQLRYKKQALSRQEKRNARLYEFSQILGDSDDINDIINNTINYIGKSLSAKAALYLTDASGELQTVSHAASTLDESIMQKETIEWSFVNKKATGRSTNTFTGTGVLYLPLVAPGSVVGIMVVHPENGEIISFEQEDFLQNITSQLSIRIERENLLFENQRSMFLAESERLYKIVLNSISHEIRTPLTAISAASSSLLDEAVDALPKTRKELTYEISKASERLNRVVENLLDMSRLESGLLKLNKQLYDIEDLISVVLRHLDHELKSHNVQVNIDQGLPMIEIDFALMEQAMMNLILNAIMHTQIDSTIIIRADRENNKMAITVSDNGPGISEKDLPVLFEKFRKGIKSLAGGIGLGLSICRGIAEAHGGSIKVRNIPTGGAEFIIILPLTENGKGDRRRIQ